MKSFMRLSWFVRGNGFGVGSIRTPEHHFRVYALGNKRAIIETIAWDQVKGVDCKILKTT